MITARRWLRATVCLLTLSGATSAADDIPRTPLPEYGIVDGPDGRYWTQQDAAWGTGGRGQIRWLPRGTTQPLSPAWADAEADESSFYYSHRHQRGCFTSNRGAVDANRDIWCVEWTAQPQPGWSKPWRLPEPVNSASTEFSPVITPDGGLLFASDRPGGLGFGDIYEAALSEDGWSVHALGPEVNSWAGEWNVELSPDGQQLLFESSHRTSNLSVPGDLYWSQRTADGWSSAVPLTLLNTRGSDLMPRFQRDGRLVIATAAGKDVDMRVADSKSLEVIGPAVVAVARSTGEVVVMEPQSLAVRARFAVGQGPHEVAVSEDGRVAFVPLFGIYPRNHEHAIEPDQLEWESSDSQGIARIDLATPGSAQPRALDQCARPHGIAATAQAERYWLTCEDAGTIFEFRRDTPTAHRSFAVGRGVHKVLYLSTQDVLIASNPETGEIYAIDLESGSWRTARSGKGAEELAVSEDEADIYVANTLDRNVCRFDANLLTREVCYSSGGAFPIALAVDASASLIWVANNASSNLTALDLVTGELKQEISLPSSPLGMAFDARNRLLYVGLPRRNEIIVIRATDGAIVRRAATVPEIDDIDLVPTTHFD